MGGVAAARRAYTLVVVWFGWVLFRFDDMRLMGHALRCLFGGGNGVFDFTARTTALNYLFILMVCIIACTPIVPWVSRKLSVAADHATAGGKVSRLALNLAAVAIPALLLILSILAMVGDSYNPFLYVRF